MRLTAPASAKDQGVASPPEQAAAPARLAGRITAALWAVTLLAALAELALTVVTWDDLKLSDGITSLYAPVAAVAYATLGVLIIRRAANLIGWIMLAEGMAIAFLELTSAYAVAGAAAHPWSLPAAKLAGPLSECSFSPVTFLIAFMFLLFPTGKLPSPRWRPVAAAGLLLAGLTVTGLAVTPRLLQLPAPGGISLVYPNPLGVENLKPVLRAVPVGTLNGLPVVFVAFMAVVLVSLAVRYRVGGRLMRQQIKWLALAAVVFAALLFIALLGVAAGEAWLQWRRERRHRGRRAVRDPGRDGDRDPQVPAVRHRRHHQPRRGLRPALGGVHRRVHRHRARHRDVRGAPGRPGAHDRGGGHDRAAVPAAAPPRAAVRESPGVRQAGHAVPGAVRLRRGHGRAAGSHRGR